jgi:hypothetical protein
MSFTLKSAHLDRLCEINAFNISRTDLVFFGLRGCLPTDPDDQRFLKQHELDLAEVTYEHPRCTIGQWQPSTGKFAVYPGSTVPTKRYVRSARLNGGSGANQMMTGFYNDYRKGIHKAGKPGAHDAFRQTSGRPRRRTVDDFDYDNEDRVEFDNPFDNLHAAYCASISAEHSSAGCQVVVGFPDVGPWRTFRSTAYNLNQNQFGYFLIDGWHARKITTYSSTEKLSSLLRYGSKGKLVTEVQKQLQALGHYEGILDDDFGPRTIKAVLRFQEETFGAEGDDGIVGPMTAEKLGITGWPTV